MEKQEKKDGWMSVPQFGGWESKAPGATDYSMVFSQARANKKQQKTDIKHASFGNEKELIAATQQDDSVMVSFQYTKALLTVVRFL
eukprot:XP_025015177.1 uncharacterized protein LOC8267754 [Ricinus communis]